MLWVAIAYQTHCNTQFLKEKKKKKKELAGFGSQQQRLGLGHADLGTRCRTEEGHGCVQALQAVLQRPGVDAGVIRVLVADGRG